MQERDAERSSLIKNQVLSDYSSEDKTKKAMWVSQRRTFQAERSENTNQYWKQEFVIHENVEWVIQMMKSPLQKKA